MTSVLVACRTLYRITSSWSLKFGLRFGTKICMQHPEFAAGREIRTLFDPLRRVESFSVHLDIS
jgi:hypothetical protein